MSSAPEGAAQRSAWTRPILTALVAVVLALVGVLAPAASAPAQAADLTKFDPGNIISNAVFFHKDAMSQAQIQSFLNSKVPTCASGATCLKSYTTSTHTIASGQMCNGYIARSSETAAAIIYKVAQSCGINPQVILVTLQKEQGLVTSTHPSQWNYDHATGANCPDNSACDPGTANFFSQVYAFGWQMKRYANPPGTSQYFTWYPVGATSKIAYSPDSSMDPGALCGFESVTIANQATADLYYYTPYTPNAAALAAGYGSGDACSSYGNRNFYNFFTDWFGSTQVLPFVSAPTPTITGTLAYGSTLTAHTGTWSPTPSFKYQWYAKDLTGKTTAISGATASTLKLGSAQKSMAISVKVTASKSTYATTSKTSAATPRVATAATPTVSGTARVGGTLTAGHGTWTSGTTFSYAWYANGSYISGTSGATHTTFTPTSAQQGKTITVKVTGSLSGYGTVAKTSAATSKVALTATPTISGTRAVGSTLTANHGTWTTGTAFSYAWYADGTYITGTSGTTHAKFTLTKAQQGKKISVKVTGSLSGYPTVARTSASTAKVALSATPTITGTPHVGSTLTANHGTWTTGTAFSYAWYANGAYISGTSGPTHSTFKPTSSQKGKTITVKVTGTKSGYSTVTRTSAATAKVS